MSERDNPTQTEKKSPLQTFVGLSLAVITLLLMGGLLFGGLTCAIRVVGGEEAYDLWLYRNGLQEGDYITYHDNGQIASVKPYSNGKTNGEARFFDTQGRLLKVVMYKKGTQNGPYTLYYPNGSVRERGKHHMGDTLGTPERFDEEGKPLP